MPVLMPDDGLLTVLNIFSTDSVGDQLRLIGVMRDVIDRADYPGWVSSTLHEDVLSPGSANLIQWRSREDMEARNATDEAFRHRELPIFRELAVTMRLLQTSVIHTSTPEGRNTEIPLDGDATGCTVIELARCRDEDLAPLLEALRHRADRHSGVPGCRGSAVLRGVGTASFDGAFAVHYGRWDSLEAWRRMCHEEHTSDDRVAQFSTDREVSAYQVIHARSAEA
ncbi:antibiotic biosynthesis monooxygenase [Streptomyces sp. NPDC035033]|uniref:antibiotic biosynthesis monooxygenase family protein n=1 Tax=Streptomyces sp. NPDC035033 TaxID=3155368 RepID=UPI0033DC44E0